MLLRRLAYPSRLSDLKAVFGRSETAMSVIINDVLDYIYRTHGHLLSDLNKSWLFYERLEQLAVAVTNKDAPLPNCWASLMAQ